MVKEERILILFALVFIISASLASAACADKIISYWQFEDNFKDTRSLNNGTNFGANFVDGRVGKAISLNGVGQYIEVNDSVSLEYPRQEITIEAWIKIDEGGKPQTILEKDFGTENCWGSYELSINESNKLSLGVLAPGASCGSGSYIYYDSSQTISAGTWYHVAGTYSYVAPICTGIGILRRCTDESKVGKLYINGTSVPLTTRTAGTFKTIGHSSGAGKLWIGKLGSRGGNESMFDGLIDEVAVYNTSLSGLDILDHYHSGLSGEDYCGRDLSASIAACSVDFGDGSDGALAVSSPNIIVNSYANANQDILAGATTIPVDSASGFQNGDEVMIIQMQGIGAGKYEFKKNIQISGNNIILPSGTLNSYFATGTSSNNKVNIIRIPQYTTVTVNSGGSLIASPWDGNKGGVLAFRANGEVNITNGGSIDVSGKGYRGGSGSGAGSCGGCYSTAFNAYQGESFRKLGIRDTSDTYGGMSLLANDGGGGGSGCACNEGKGGGYGTSGSIQGGCTGNGNIYGSINLTRLYLGSGGGGSVRSSAGGKGGGAIFISGKTINVSGQIIANGSAGGAATLCGCHPGGCAYAAGGGSGGSVYLIGNEITSGTGKILAGGGIGGYQSYPPVGYYGGWGGSGRIRIDYNTSITGISAPETKLINCYVSPTGPAPPTPATATGANWTNMQGEIISNADLNDFVKLKANLTGLEGKQINFTIYRGTALIDKKILTASDSIISITWKANKTDITNGYKFGAVASDGSSTEKFSNILKVSATESNAVPVANITNPLSRGIYFIDENIAFNQSSYDVDDNITISWNFGDGQTSAIYNAAHNYSTSGQKNIVLTVTDSRGAISIARASILIINLSESKEYILALISNPKEGASINGNSVDLNAAETYAIYYNATTRIISCTAGNCPLQTGNGTAISGAPNLAGFSKISFNWNFNDNNQMSGNGNAGALVTKRFSLPGWHSVELAASVNQSSSTSSRFYTSFTLPACMLSGSEWLASGIFSSSLNDCSKEEVAEGSSKICCPLDYGCSSGKCVTTGETLRECSDYITQEKCESYSYAVSSKSVDTLAKKENYCGSWINGSCTRAVENCRCIWASGICKSAYSIVNRCEETSVFQGECIFSAIGKTNCTSGFRTIQWTAEWTGNEADMPEECRDGNKKILCLASELSFFSLPSLIVAALLILIFYCIGKRK